MITDVAKAQANTLEDWARQWGGETMEGANDVAFLLHRTARQIRRAIGLPEPMERPPLPAGKAVDPNEKHTDPPLVEEPRGDEKG